MSDSDVSVRGIHSAKKRREQAAAAAAAGTTNKPRPESPKLRGPLDPIRAPPSTSGLIMSGSSSTRPDSAGLRLPLSSVPASSSSSSSSSSLSPTSSSNSPHLVNLSHRRPSDLVDASDPSTWPPVTSPTNSTAANNTTNTNNNTNTPSHNNNNSNSNTNSAGSSLNSTDAAFAAAVSSAVTNWLNIHGTAAIHDWMSIHAEQILRVAVHENTRVQQQANAAVAKAIAASAAVAAQAAVTNSHRTKRVKPNEKEEDEEEGEDEEAVEESAGIRGNNRNGKQHHGTNGTPSPPSVSSSTSSLSSSSSTTPPFPASLRSGELSSRRVILSSSSPSSALGSGYIPPSGDGEYMERDPKSIIKDKNRLFGGGVVGGAAVGASTAAGEARADSMISSVLPPSGSSVRGRSARASAATGSSPTMSSPDLLLVEDIRMSQRLAHAALTRAHFKVEVASDGETAVEMYRQHAATLRVILMDIHLPGISGIEATERIRDMERKSGSNNPVRVYGLTGAVDEMNLRGYERAGMNGCIEKGQLLAQSVQRAIELSDQGIQFVNLCTSSGPSSSTHQADVQARLAANLKAHSHETDKQSDVEMIKSDASSPSSASSYSSSPDAMSVSPVSPTRTVTTIVPITSSPFERSSSSSTPSSSSSSSSASSISSSSSTSSSTKSKGKPKKVVKVKSAALKAKEALADSAVSAAGSSVSNAPAPYVPGSSPGTDLLLVEDVRASQRLTQQILTRIHFKVDVASDGKTAVAKYQQLINTVRVILMDIGLPGISGIEATELIRKYEQSEEGQRRRGGLPPVAVYGLTANVNSENLKEYERAGLNGCISKGNNIATAVQQVLIQSHKYPGAFINLVGNPDHVTVSDSPASQSALELAAAAQAASAAAGSSNQSLLSPTSPSTEEESDDENEEDRTMLDQRIPSGARSATSPTSSVSSLRDSDSQDLISTPRAAQPRQLLLNSKFQGRGLVKPGIGLPSASSTSPASSSSSSRSLGSSSSVSTGIVANRTRNEPDLLLVEDVRVSQRLAQQHLTTKAHYKVEVASDGESAVAKFQQYSHSIQIILMDVGLPGISGVEATERIRKLEQSGMITDRNSPVFIFGLTANVNETNLREYEAAGMNGCIAKGTYLVDAVKEAVETCRASPGKFVNLVGKSTFTSP